jgi:hypothetical protein
MPRKQRFKPSRKPKLAQNEDTTMGRPAGAPMHEDSTPAHGPLPASDEGSALERERSAWQG